MATARGGLLGILLAVWSAAAASAHETPEGVQGKTALNWQAPNVSRVLTAGYPDSLGLFAFFGRKGPVLHQIDGKACVTANFLAFDVADSYAFDIDEAVTLSFLFHAPSTPAVYMSYDRNGIAEPVERVEVSAGDGGWSRVHMTLERARFAGRGMAGTDIALTTEGTYVPGKEEDGTQFTLCGLTVERSFQSAQTHAPGRLALKVLSGDAPVPARIGIYDATGRAMIPGTDALALDFYEQQTRQFKVRGSILPRPFWPHENRYIFYTDGAYTQSLPAGRYKLVVSRGPEYRTIVRDIEVQPGDATDLTVSLERFSDMQQLGWVSGDVHIHMARERADNDRILAFMAAEDVQLANLLQMNSFGADHFRQYAFGQDGRAGEGGYQIVPGVEGPRTGHRGHTIALNITEAHHRPEDYFLYHRYFDAYQAQGGITGYAHVGSEEFLASRGLALDAPFGYVDFVEIMQNSRLRPALWYELLNLGFRVAPAAGSDFPYFDQPGSVRNYVRMDESGGADAWFQGFKAGHTFVTNGPLVDITVGGQGMGGTVALDGDASALPVKVAARLNPDLGQLTRLDLVQCGEVIHSTDLDGDTQMSVNLPVSGSGWVAARVYGENDMLAHTGAVYLVGAGGTSRCGAKLHETARLMIDRLNALAEADFVPARELEYWETVGMAEAYGIQKDALTHQIAKAKHFYLGLVQQ